MIKRKIIEEVKKNEEKENNKEDHVQKVIQ